MGEFQQTNRLVDETSPYLLQHKHNPVDWYPWGNEAHARAKVEDKPIFLMVNECGVSLWANFSMLID